MFEVWLVIVNGL